MEDLTFTHTVTVTEDDFLTIEFYLKFDTFEGSLDKAFEEILDDFLFCEDYVRHGIWEYHKDEILEKFKEWQKNS